MQDPKEIEEHYKRPDPWDYKTNPDDYNRKQKVISTAKFYAPKAHFYRALDIGAGEGWITHALPADEIDGYELSESARSRFPDNVNPIVKPEGTYDLVTATGVMYGHYDYEHFIDLIVKHASDIVITCNISTWEVNEFKHERNHANIGLKQVYMEYFKYREFIQALRVFRVMT